MIDRMINSHNAFALSSFLFTSLGLIVELYEWLWWPDIYVPGTNVLNGTMQFLLNLGGPVSSIGVFLFFLGVILAIRCKFRGRPLK